MNVFNVKLLPSKTYPYMAVYVNRKGGQKLYSQCTMQAYSVIIIISVHY